MVSGKVRATVHVAPMDSATTTLRAAVAFGAASGGVALESSHRIGRFARWSIYACDPVDEVVVTGGGGGEDDDVWRRLADRLNACPPLDSPPDGWPFTGGWIGAIAYEAVSVPRVRARSLAAEPVVPPARMRLYDHAALYDHDREAWYAAAVEWPAGFIPGRPGAAIRLERIRRLLRAAPDPSSIMEPVGPSTMISRLNRAAYEADVRRVKRYIAAGDVYQVNLTRRFLVRTEASPLATYLRLRETMPATHAAFLPGEDVSILCASPELFLDLRGRRVVTRPVKGTRPRGRQAEADDVSEGLIEGSGSARPATPTCSPLVRGRVEEELRESAARGRRRIHERKEADRREPDETDRRQSDEAYRRDLAISEKDRAELTMIVDLLRNDLNRVCTPESVRVVHPGEIEAHPTVYHRTATIEGELQPGRSRFDLLRATFPGGSVTGAPKIRAMQIIRERERVPRGVYCGAIGYLGLDGAMCLNLAIRTMVQSGEVVSAHAGGGIVADSTPEGEFAELLVKARGMLEALGLPPGSEVGEAEAILA